MYDLVVDYIKSSSIKDSEETFRVLVQVLSASAAAA